ncbi:MAG: hypothetical protein MJ227_02800 [Bacilli bacterium]|nr:hypothetical protein [Bacilli bacterium]
MDNLKSLMDKKEYSLVVKLTENSNDATSLFYRLSSFLALGQPDKSLEVIENNKAILKTNLALLIKIHLEILCILGRFDDAYNALREYENMPYESQQVEEILRDSHKYIRMEEKKALQVKSFSNEQIIEKLQSKDADEVLIALDMVRDKDISLFIAEIKLILATFPKQSIRSFALLLLVNKKYNDKITFLSQNGLVEVVPCELQPPFIGDDFNNFLREMQIDYKDPSLVENATQILSSYLLYIYPNRVDDDNKTLLLALKAIAMDYMKSGNDEFIFNEGKEKNIDINKVNSLKNKINKALEDF